MSQSILYNKSLNSSEIPIPEFKTFKRKLRVYCGLSLILSLLLIAISIVLVLLWFGIINRKPAISLNRIITVKCGQIEGNITDGIAVFLGIPYAYPPIGRRRFFHSQEIIDEKGCNEVYGRSSKPYQATGYKSPCIQYNRDINNLTGSEDCLYLNVYTPSTSLESKLPVVFIISSIFFMYGSGNMPGLLVLPEVVKTTNAIHVTSNFRLGPMNSIINPENLETNHGLSDQLVALEWVRKNIHAFGGDPSNVILYGVGSGSTIALALYNSNKASHLFSKMWLSNPVTSIKTTLSEALKSQKSHLSQETKTVYLQKTLRLEDIYKNWTWQSVDKILENRWFNFPSPHSATPEDNNVNFLLIDNDFIKESNILRRIRNRNTPLVIGNNANEVDIFPSPKTVRLWQSDYYKSFIQWKVKNFSKKVNDTFAEIFNSHYAKDTHLNSEDSYTRVVTDIRITCPLNSLLKKVMGHYNSQLIYRYLLDDRHEYFDYFDMKYSTILAAHGWDNILYFHGYKTHSNYGRYSDKERNMSKILNEAMHDFAWNDRLKNMFVSKDGNILLNLIKNGTISKECYYKQPECTFWESHLGNVEEFIWFV